VREGAFAIDPPAHLSVGDADGIEAEAAINCDPPCVAAGGERGVPKGNTSVVGLYSPTGTERPTGNEVAVDRTSKMLSFPAR